jgi:hypothetical protein
MVEIPIDWAVDVLPQIRDFIAQDVVMGPIVFIVTLSLGTLSARALIGVFFKRD